MTTIVTRAGKGSPLTNTEVDTNFTNLNDAKIETLTSTDTSVTITGTGSTRNLSVPVNPNVVSGPASATDNAVARFDGTTGKLVQNSVVTVDDTGVIAGASISGATNTLSNINLATQVSGTLPIANGGTGATTAAEAFSDLTPLTLTTASATTLFLNNTSGYQQQIVGSTSQQIFLPNTATLAVGWSFLITNGTGNTVTVLTSTGALVYANANIGSYRVWCVSTANNNAASWSSGAETFSFETGTGSVVRATSPTIASATLTSPTATGSLSFTGTTNQAAQFATSQTSGNTSITTSQTSGTLTIGGTSGTGAQTIGRSTVSQQTDIQAGATNSGSTKTMNIGTGGLSGSTTNIAIGSTTGTSTTTLNGALSLQNALPVAQGGTGQTTAVAAFNALNPMTTTGDIIYEASATTAARLGIGATGEVLTVVGGLPAWAAAGGGFPTGTLMLFQQTAAPTGWTKQTTHNNKALRVVSGTASSGGSVAFTTAFAANSVGSTTITTSTMPSHTHTFFNVSSMGGSTGVQQSGGSAQVTTTSSTGSDGSHTHSFQSLAVQYVDLIIASKD